MIDSIFLCKKVGREMRKYYFVYKFQSYGQVIYKNQNNATVLA